VSTICRSKNTTCGISFAASCNTFDGEQSEFKGAVMLSGPHKNETTQADLPENITPAYPDWVKEFINRRIDAAIERAKIENTRERVDPVPSVKPKPR
jgi:hypothetical protein